MLLVEWHSWWGSLPALEAREYIATYRVALLADAGWKMENRETILDEWRQLAKGALVLRFPEAVARRAGDIRGEIVALFGWMRNRFTGGDAAGFGESR